MFVLFLMVFDIIIDVAEGEPISHMVLESFVLIVAAIGATYLWLKTVSLGKETNQLRSKVNILHKDL